MPVVFAPHYCVVCLPDLSCLCFNILGLCCLILQYLCFLQLRHLINLKLLDFAAFSSLYILSNDYYFVFVLAFVLASTQFYRMPVLFLLVVVHYQYFGFAFFTCNLLVFVNTTFFA